MEDKQYTPREATAIVLAAARQRLETGLASLTKAEALGKSVHGLPTTTPSTKAISDGDPHGKPKQSRTVFKMLAARQASQPTLKGETFISTENGSDAIKRYVEKGKQGVLPGDKKSKVIESEGSGGGLAKAGDKMSTDAVAKPPKAEKGPALKPAGVPGAEVGKAPSIPKPPAAPGAKGMTMKSDKCGVFGRLQAKGGK